MKKLQNSPAHPAFICKCVSLNSNKNSWDTFSGVAGYWFCLAARKQNQLRFGKVNLTANLFRKFENWALFAILVLNKKSKGARCYFSQIVFILSHCSLMLQNMNRFQELHAQKRSLKWIVSGQGQSESNPNLIEFSSSSLSVSRAPTQQTLWNMFWTSQTGELNSQLPSPISL